MPMGQKRTIVSGLILAAALSGAAIGGSSGAASGARRVRGIVPANFTNKVDNPFMPWKPGTLFRYKRSEPGAWNPVSVTHRTKRIVGVKCVVVRDVGKLHGQPQEKSLDWYAQDKKGNVWYFGE